MSGLLLALYMCDIRVCALSRHKPCALAHPACVCMCVCVCVCVCVCALWDFNIALLLQHLSLSLWCPVLPNSVFAEKQLLTFGTRSLSSVGSTVGAAKVIRWLITEAWFVCGRVHHFPMLNWVSSFSLSLLNASVVLISFLIVTHFHTKKVQMMRVFFFFWGFFFFFKTTIHFFPGLC